MNWYRVENSCVKLTVKVKPNAKVTGVKEVTDDELILNISAPAVDNKANKELIAFMSKSFKVPKSSVKITCGSNTTSKLVVISGLDECIETIEEFVCSS
ncbi:hypothetical protein CWI42_080260 [Ordospora colligata]|uniref:Uncharacterized protein n=1 Tax=Ordospora colligata OC4 TaxID=1354746 RepID=A0A0B2UJU0_9MICR|nr:uncharacterized protein M896_080260 [Ordospora colligata OC4]KHN69292.1 hypothetical protein M896_080260 [Ordospora colligata OC4]TBU15108.1 hypothetical protein CWI41_080270 [Ordospora colligata]TBU15159.1 hypothetical protein CWI40_080270 [Ordospora colligata]TBU18405.1 hypothetical protein CWI42_080260 [Ordospora colligata]